MYFYFFISLPIHFFRVLGPKFKSKDFFDNKFFLLVLQRCNYLIIPKVFSDVTQNGLKKKSIKKNQLSNRYYFSNEFINKIIKVYLNC